MIGTEKTRTVPSQSEQYLKRNPKLCKSQKNRTLYLKAETLEVRRVRDTESRGFLTLWDFAAFEVGKKKKKAQKKKKKKHRKRQSREISLEAAKTKSDETLFLPTLMMCHFNDVWRFDCFDNG